LVVVIYNYPNLLNGRCFIFNKKVVDNVIFAFIFLMWKMFTENSFQFHGISFRHSTISFLIVL